ncbi:N-acetylmuramoyl-L-alanine amidase, partial [Actinospica acidiphila]|nr:N-acetylmuramoyl-L-alanine amidase [Actinospica acidiphila]
MPLGFVPGAAAAVALVLSAYGVERAAESSDAQAAARPVPAFHAPRP